MRKDVKRSLLFWPAATATSIALVSGFTLVGNGLRPSIPTRTASETTFDAIPAAVTEVVLSSRDEHGRRAMQMPQRVAAVLGVDALEEVALHVDAPAAATVDPLWGGKPTTHPTTKSTNRATVGLVAKPWEADHALPSDTLAATPRARQQNAAVARQQEVKLPTTGDVPAKREIDLSALLEGILDFDQPGTHLPKSNRLLAKPVFASRSDTSNSGQEPPRARPQTNAALTVNAATDSTRSGTPLVDARADEPTTPPMESSVRPIAAPVPAWPATRALDQQLRALTTVATADTATRRDRLVSTSNRIAEMHRWAIDVSGMLEQLQSLPRLGDDDAERLIGALRQSVIQGAEQAEMMSDRELQIQWLGATYAVARRVAVWEPICKLANSRRPIEPVHQNAVETERDGSGPVVAAIARVRQSLTGTGDPAGWERFLILSDIDQAAQSDDQALRMKTAQEFLSRIHRRDLHPAHQRWLGQESVVSLGTAIRPWAIGVVDHAELLSMIEQQENDPTDHAAPQIAAAMKTLRYINNPLANEVSESIDTHYRNANLRVAISEQMLNRLLPAVPTQSVPVRARMMGSQIRGTSKIDSQLRVTVVPSPNQWMLRLNTNGRIRSRSTGYRGAVAVDTSGNAMFDVTTPIRISDRGVNLGESDAIVRGRTMLQRVRTDYDRVPLVGTVVRGIVANRFESMSATSNQVANGRIASEVENKVDQQLEEQLGQATDRFGKLILGPLGRLQLDPTVTDMQTTDTRLLARYRLAGDDQLAAFTPRPRAMSDSLASAQVHQSAINNMLAQLVPTDQPTPIRQAIAGAFGTFGDHDLDVPDDIPADVSVQFVKTRPVTVEFADGLVWITMRVVQLKRGSRLNLTKFIVRACYRPRTDGLRAELVREGHLRISGPGMSMRERLPVRAIFNKVLSPNRPLPITTTALAQHEAVAGLQISQLELRDGWMALAISTAAEPKVATSQR